MKMMKPSKNKNNSKLNTAITKAFHHTLTSLTYSRKDDISPSSGTSQRNGHTV